jgi:hypothetical protein
VLKYGLNETQGLDMGAVLTKERFARSKALIAGILAGLAAPATIGAPVEYPRPQGDDLSRLRGDVLRLGGTFRTVIEQERVTKASRKTQAGA